MRSAWSEPSVQQLFRRQDGVASRNQLALLGVTRHDIRNQVSGGRWEILGRHTVGSGAAGATAHVRRALFEVRAFAVLDGASALQQHGLTGWTTTSVDVSTTHTRGRKREIDGVIVHRLRRCPYVEHEVGRVAPPSTAAYRAAQWAPTRRAAATVLAMSVQQGVVNATDLLTAARTSKHTPARPFIERIALDLADGVESLGELDFALLCRQWGLPAPTRQSLKHTPHGRIYLDAEWDEQDLVVEIDGAQHRQGLAYLNDAMRDNKLVLSGRRVIRIPVLALRVDPTPFMCQIATALGCARV